MKTVFAAGGWIPIIHVTKFLKAETAPTDAFVKSVYSQEKRSDELETQKILKLFWSHFLKFLELFSVVVSVCELFTWAICCQDFFLFLLTSYFWKGYFFEENKIVSVELACACNGGTPTMFSAHSHFPIKKYNDIVRTNKWFLLEEW